jgi:hypothetical protein
MAGMFALLNVAQTSVIAALATGPRSDQYSWAAFSVFANAGIFLFSMLSFVVLAAVGALSPREERNEPPPLTSPA